MAIAPASNLLGEITNFLAAAPSTQEIVTYKPSEGLDQRLHCLLNLNSAAQLSREERNELDEYLTMSHFLKMLKYKAQLQATK